MINKNITKIMYLLTTLFLSPIAYAAPDIKSFINVFNMGGSFLEKLLSSPYALFGITVVIFTILLYNLFTPLIGRIPVFKGDKGLTNKYGRAVALTLSLLSSLGMFGLLFLNGGGVSVRDSLTNILGPFSTLAGILMGFLIFGIVWFGFKDSTEGSPWNRALSCAGLAMVFMGYLLSRPPLFALGWIIVFIFLLIFILKRDPDSGGSGGGSGGDDGDDEHPPDFSTFLNQINSLLNDYYNELRNLVRITRDILQTHHDYLRSIGGYGPPSPPVSQVQWNSLWNCLHKLNVISVRINHLFNTITRSAGYRKMKRSEQKRYVKLSVKFSEYIQKRQDIYDDFNTRYTAGNPPA